MSAEPSQEAVERITAAAIKIGPCIYTGPHHATIIHYVARCTGETPVIGEQGFLTSEGRFVGRTAARDIAVRAGQLDRSHHDRTLFSEFLWSVPDHSEDRNLKPVDSGEVNRNRVTGDRIEEAVRELGAREGGIYWSQLLPILQRLYDDGKKAGAEEAPQGEDPRAEELRRASIQIDSLQMDNALLERDALHARAEATRLAAENAKLRETNTALNRRATRAEAIAAQRVEDQERKGKSLGRSLANAGYYSLRAENQRLWEAATEAEWCLSVHATCDCGQDVKLRAALDPPTTAP